MSAKAQTFQCYRCAGYLRAEVEPMARVQCPHCQWVAAATEFRLVGEGELGSMAAGDAPAPANIEIGGDAWLQKGKFIQFACPHCARPMRMRKEEAGGLTDCPHCGLEIIAPDPGAGLAARLSDASLRNVGPARKAIQPRALHSPKPAPVDEAPSLEEADQTLASTGDDVPGITGADVSEEGFANPFAPPAPQAAGGGDAGPVRHRGVRMLGVEQLGAAFQARDDLDGPDELRWERGAAGPAEDKIFNDRRGRWFGIVAGVLLAGVGTFFVVLEFNRRGEIQQQARSEATAVQQAKDEREERHARAFETARRAVGAEDWKGMLPFVRSRDRVEPLMKKFYAENDYGAVQLAERVSVLEISPGGIPYVQLTTRCADGVERLVGLQAMPDGSFAFDWELWVDLASHEWERFLSERPTTPVPLRITIARSSPLPRYVEDAGLASVDEARALRVWLKDSGAMFYAVFPRTDEALMEVWDDLDWDRGRRVIAEVAFPGGGVQPDRVALGRVLQTRWLVP